VFVKFCCFHFADSDSETLDGSTSYVTLIVTVASLIAGFTVLIVCTFCCPRRRGGSGSQVVFVDFFCDFLQFLSVGYIGTQPLFVIGLLFWSYSKMGKRKPLWITGAGSSQQFHSNEGNSKDGLQPRKIT